ncbi:glutathione S-transferase family protein [Pseudomonas sp. RIT-PI-AD]|uniref:glutathione S-transferase family protein n=1 Tax=Pseudomonas sp. RIT-PI-AD TaxID=3035294 RepID=UPI0021D83AE6|nr:glutathione S-transferase family protein [Pseudomonas sp. RIT-PI-AD]
MSLTLYGAPLSPFVRKVRLFLAEQALDYHLEMVTPWAAPAWYRELNPLARIPALRDGDFTLADSSVICQYLQDKHTDRQPLCGSDPEARARVRWLEKYADYELAPLTTFGVFRNRVLKPIMGKASDEAAVQAHLEKLPPHLDYLERALGDADYFVGGALSVADLATVCQWVNLEYAGETLDEQRWPKLAAHYARIKARPLVRDLLTGERQVLAQLCGAR